MKLNLGSVVVTGFLAAAGLAQSAHAQEASNLPPYLYDRGDGIRTSLIGTYVRPNEFVFYPFYEYTRTRNFEYAPSEVGGVGTTDFQGKKYEREFLVFLGYAFNDSLLVEFESALHSTVEFRKAPDDTSNAPAQLRESGVGDTEAQIRWRIAKETETRPDTVLFFETVFPLQRSKKLLGTQDWEFSTGAVLTKGYSFGTLSVRGGVGYNTGDHKFKVGEYAIDYLKKLSPAWRVALSLEGHESELSIIGEVQYTLSKDAILKINSGFGISSKDRAFAPEIGVLFRF
jgi:hypothetical protein